MTRETRRRRLTLARLALIAWLGFVVVASVGPFLVSIIVWRPQSFGLLKVGDGGAYWHTEHSILTAQLGAPASEFSWGPNAMHWASFQLNLYPRGVPAGTKPIMEVTAPPWAVLLAPTLLVLGVHRGRRWIMHRRKSRALPPGRTPCPACQYDATGLTICPECGASVGAGRAG